MNMRAIIVDDEELARRGIRALLNRAGDVEIVSECGSCEEAIRAISAAEPEVGAQIGALVAAAYGLR